MWVKWFCRVPFFNDNIKFLRSSCNVALDMYGDHVLHFRSGFQFSGAPRTRRPDSTFFLSVADLIQAVGNAIIEARCPENFQSLPDMKTLGTTGAIYFMDVTYIHLRTDACLESCPDRLFKVG